MSVFKPQITKTISATPDIPAGVKVGDFIVARYTKSEWALIWDDWHHAAMVTNLDPLTIIEASGIPLGKDEKGKEVKEGVVEYEFQKPRIIKKLDGKEINGSNWIGGNLIKVKWIQPIFPDPIREKDHWLKPRILKKKITEEEARKRAIEYARKQIGEPFEKLATKWDENEWYCSLLIFKSYSMTITDMYLEDYSWKDKNGVLLSTRFSSGFWVTPEDLVDSRRSKVFHSWVNEKYSL
ncbi:hypothetical protein KKF38_04965 [Patescibacteria group bacterium]|nr:hypothetical protein [Patescibacteria group bacterium]